MTDINNQDSSSENDTNIEALNQNINTSQSENSKVDNSQGGAGVQQKNQETVSTNNAQNIPKIQLDTKSEKQPLPKTDDSSKPPTQYNQEVPVSYQDSTTNQAETASPIQDHALTNTNSVSQTTNSLGDTQPSTHGNTNITLPVLTVIPPLNDQGNPAKEGQQIPETLGKGANDAKISIEQTDRGKLELEEVEKPRSKCHNIFKQWMGSWRSLAPRTRKLIRTAVVAVISGIVLVAIFHLARLAEHPSQNELKTDSKEKIFVEESEQMKLEESFHNSNNNNNDNNNNPGIFKDAKGKVRPLKNKEFSNIKEEILSKAKGDVVIHPDFGVPVAKDFLNSDIMRIKAQRKRFNRVANRTEILKTLEIVQKTVNEDRKKLKNKELKYWSPGDTPLRILLVTTWRSGSTFLGQVLQEHPAVYQHYEPLSYVGVRQVRSGRDAFQAHQLVHRLLDCRYDSQSDYMNYTRTHPQDMLGHNKRVWSACKEGPNPNSCNNATFLSKSCEMFPIQLVKSVRMRLNLTQIFLNDEKFNAKVVFLVRDPRGTMNSRYSSVSWCSEHPDCSSPEALCKDLEGDLKVAGAFKKLYPQKFTTIKYEDLALNPEKEIQSLMEFLGLEYSEDIASYVAEHTQENVDKPWSVKRKSSDRISLWKKQLPLEEIHTVQNACENVLKSLNYEIMGQ